MPCRELIAMNDSKPVSWLVEQFGKGEDFLVVDCRPSADYQAAHVRGAINVTLPSLLLRRLANGKISLAAAIKCNEGREKFAKMCGNSTIVLCDEKGEEGAGGNGVLPVLMRRLRQDGCTVVFLEGGFSSFHSVYPEWCRVEHGVSSSVFGLENLRINCSDDSESDEVDECGMDSSLCLRENSPLDESAFPVEILPYLYLGNAKNSADETALERHQIKYILNVTSNLPNKFEQNPSIKYMQIPINDHWSQNLGTFFPDAIAFIDEARQQQLGVLVHCLAGISRSVTITVAYLMHSQNLSLNDAYDFVKQRKANISPNFNFMGQLLDFERQLNMSPGQTSTSFCSSCSSSAFSSPDSTLSPFCHCCHLQAPRNVMHFMDQSHASPDSGIEFENWA